MSLGMDLEVPKVHARPVSPSLYLLPVNPNVSSHSATTPVPCLPACLSHVPNHEVMD